jgi:nucleotide-binding universal stress UspA family protein
MRNVLAAIDFSDISTAVVGSARSLAAHYSAHLHLVHVAPPDPEFVGYDPGPQYVRDHAAKDLRAEHRQLQELARNLANDGLAVTAHCLQGSTIETILKKAVDTQADVIVVGSHGRGALSRMVLGSVSHGVVQGSACPVLVVPVRGKSSS